MYLVSGVLELGSVQGSAVEIAKVDMNDIIRKSVESFSGLAAYNGNELVFETAADLHLIPGNADLMTQVLINLLTNANRHIKG